MILKYDVDTMFADGSFKGLMVMWVKGHNFETKRPQSGQTTYREKEGRKLLVAVD